MSLEKYLRKIGWAISKAYTSKTFIDVLIFLFFAIPMQGLFFVLIREDGLLLTITSYAFAIVLGLAAICFSYSGTIVDTEAKSKVIFCGQRLLMSSIYFLFSASFYFCLIKLSAPILNKLPCINVIKFAVRIFYTILITFSFINMLRPCADLLKHLGREVRNGLSNDKEEKI